MMRFDLVFVLVDLGVPWYKQAASEMIRSARRAYKGHDMRVVQLSDSKTAPHPDADGVFGFKTDVATENLCQFKGQSIATYALQADRPVIFCDVDLLWNNDGLLARIERHTINLLHREDRPSMPYNTGIIVAPDPFPVFWEDYRDICGDLPAEVCGWWGDQIAMAIAPRGFDDSAINEMKMDEIAPAPDTLPREPLPTPAVHFKGDRKSMMFQYARMLDKDAFDFVRPMPDVALRGEVAAINSPEILRRHGWAF